ncbi:MAG: molybdopterin-dependent oxidoreductase [Chloroflexi bacterium]|nr:molybdopterin-dependent oxidoreductase [Chloroflexota bacterium]
MNDPSIHTVSTICGGCHNMCPMYVDVKDNHIIRSYGVPGDPRTGGALCSKGLAAAQIAHDPRRLIHPMRRNGPRGSGKFEQISWEEALKVLAEKMLAARSEFGPQSVAFVRGQASGWGFPYDNIQRLAHVMGTEVSGGASECFVPRAVAEALTYGAVPLYYDYDHTDLMIFWGRQPTFSGAPLLRKIFDAHDRGARLVVIDPLRFHLAARADQVVQIEPGTDLAMMLGMMYEITERGLWDQKFVDTYTNDPGLVRLRAHLRGENRMGIAYTPEWAESICGIKAPVIRSLAVEYATTRKACIIPGHGLEGRVNVTHTTRALAILRVITGHIDSEGCDVFTLPGPMRNPAYFLEDRVIKDYVRKDPVELFAVPPYTPENVHYPFLFMGQGLIPTPDMIHMMSEGKIKVAFMQGANPMVTLPQPKVTRAALDKIEYLAVADPYMSETAKFADLVLPAATYLERTEPEWFKWDAWLSTVSLRQQVVQIGEARSDSQMLIDLGRALGFNDVYPTDDIVWYINEDLKTSGLTYDDLREHPFGIELAPIVYRKYEKDGFALPGGKAHIWSELLAGAGFDGIPVWEESSESIRSKPEIARDYPFTVFSGRAGPMYVHSQRRTIPWLRELEPTPKVMIHPQKANELGIGNDDWTIVESPRGSIRIQAELNPAIRPEWLYVPGNWTEANYNELGIDSDVDPISSQSNYMMCLGRIKIA